MGVLEKLLTQTSPEIAFVIGLLWVIYKLGSLWITKHFETMVPVYERGVVALEKLTEVGQQVGAEITREQRTLSTGVRAAWDEIEAVRALAVTKLAPAGSKDMP